MPLLQSMLWGVKKKIAKEIIKCGADYVLCVKNNQPNLLSAVETEFEKNKLESSDINTVFGHGRIETRTCDVITDLSGIPRKDNWDKLTSIIRIKSERIIKNTDKNSCEYRYYISSCNVDAESFNSIIRSHWAIENNLHWNLDVIYNEDKQLQKKDNSAANMHTMRVAGLYLLEREKTFKKSKNGKKIKAVCDDKYRELLIFS